MSQIAETVAAIAAQSLTAQSLIEQARERARRASDLNPIAHADWDAALAEARARDAQAKAGARLGPLHGVPVSIKDLFNVRGMPTQGGTRAPLHELSDAEAGLVTRLREAGAVIFAKTNMHEIALGATGENRWTGDVKNPFDPARQAGGSSSGAGVSVATGIGLAGIGSDTGGSVRIPAAFCGVAGFKPTFGAIPLDGALYLSWTCDHAGPLARSVDDCARLFEVMARRSVAHGAVARKPRFAVPADWLRGRLQPAVREHFERACASLRAAGAEIVDVATPLLPTATDCYTPIVRAEAAWVHRRALEAGGEGFSELVLPPLEAGRKLSALDYIDAMKRRDRIRAELDAIATGCDAMLMPSSGALPPLRGQADVEVEGGRISVREAVLGQTLPFSMCGLPALSIPAGLVADGYGAGTPPLPAGLQLVGRFDGDASLLALGRWVEGLVGSAPMPAGF
ncbi:amidase [Zeimonas arvi]|uniref:Amidase n=1 Tax=Zeimonas arvi TaxID=2498847 RepID=A0A5C8NYV1_9BURK|nr:amidase [Zeimonas arvi]TXL66262.1 amidase [Zeimonas arvi]